MKRQKWEMKTLWWHPEKVVGGGRGEGGGVSVEDKWTLDSKCAYLIFFVGPNEVCHSVLWSLLSAACKELQIDSRWRKDLEGSGFSCYGALCKYCFEASCPWWVVTYTQTFCPSVHCIQDDGFDVGKIWAMVSLLMGDLPSYICLMLVTNDSFKLQLLQVLQRLKMTCGQILSNQANQRYIL